MSLARIARWCVRQSSEVSAFDVAFQIRRRCQIHREWISGGTRVAIAPFTPAVPRAMLDQMMQFGRTKILLEPGALFASVTLVVKRYRVLNFRSDVRYRTAAATGKFP